MEEPKYTEEMDNKFNISGENEYTNDNSITQENNFNGKEYDNISDNESDDTEKKRLRKKLIWSIILPCITIIAIAGNKMGDGSGFFSAIGFSLGYCSPLIVTIFLLNSILKKTK